MTIPKKLIDIQLKFFVLLAEKLTAPFFKQANEKEDNGSWAKKEKEKE